MTSTDQFRRQSPSIRRGLAACVFTERPVRLWTLLCGLAIFFMITPHSSAQVQDERAVRAAFVYNLTKYVEWPRSGPEFVIGFIGDRSVGSTLEHMLTGKSTNNRTIRILLSPSDEQLAQCDLVYIASSSSKEVESALVRVRNHSILTIGETDAFAHEGGMIGLVRSGDHIQIQINLDAAQQSHLKISSRLLNVSTIIRNGKGVDN